MGETKPPPEEYPEPSEVVSEMQATSMSQMAFES